MPLRAHWAIAVAEPLDSSASLNWRKSGQSIGQSRAGVKRGDCSVVGQFQCNIKGYLIWGIALLLVRAPRVAVPSRDPPEKEDPEPLRLV
jgi:hypothetical protein